MKQWLKIARFCEWLNSHELSFSLRFRLLLLHLSQRNNFIFVIIKHSYENTIFYLFSAQPTHFWWAKTKEKSWIAKIEFPKNHFLITFFEENKYNHFCLASKTFWCFCDARCAECIIIIKQHIVAETLISTLGFFFFFRFFEFDLNTFFFYIHLITTWFIVNGQHDKSFSNKFIIVSSDAEPRFT